jgi:hypothetical protein
MRRIIGIKDANGKLVDPVCMVGTHSTTDFDVHIWESNGHREMSVRPVVYWEEDPDWREPRDLFPDQPSLEQIKDEEDRRLRNLEKSARRATTTCRRVIKAEAFNEMLTLTYRENQTDRELCKKHFSIWSKRMKRALGEFRYCASFERQERGSMHIHCATHKLPKSAVHKGAVVKAWQLGTKIWRDIVGEDNGLCFVGGKTKFGGSRRNLSSAKMAAYVSKYIMKDFADAPEESNRYSRSNGTLPKPQKMTFYGTSMGELIGALFECKDGDCIVSHSVGKWGDSYWLCTEPDPYYLQ